MTDLFNDDQTAGDQPNSATNTPNPSENSEDILDSLVGEGRKFKTVSDLAKSKIESDKFIEQIKAENAAMRESLKEMEKTQGKARTIEEVLAAIKEVQGDEGNQSPVTTEDILKAIDSRVLELDSQKARRANLEKAQSELLDKFKGDTTKAKEFVRTESSKVGLKPSELRALSETSPEAFRRILGLSNPTKGSGPSFNTEVNSAAHRGPEGTRNAAYYAELKKTLGARFWDPSIQQQRMRDATALGQKFYE